MAEDRDVSLAMSQAFKQKLAELRRDLGAKMLFAIIIDEHNNFHVLGSCVDEKTKALAEALRENFGRSMVESGSFDLVTPDEKSVARG